MNSMKYGACQKAKPTDLFKVRVFRVLFAVHVFCVLNTNSCLTLRKSVIFLPKAAIENTSNENIVTKKIAGASVRRISSRVAGCINKFSKTR